MSAAMINQTFSTFDVSTIGGSLSATQVAEYSCNFTNMWSGVRHPILYPSDSAHWSPPFLVSHNSSYEMWAPGILATPGVEAVAETGSTGQLLSEIQRSSFTGDFVRGSTTFNSNTQEQTFADIIMDPEFPLLSTITMIAPSPDWFSGFYNFSAVDLTTNTWYGEFVIDTYPWDSGTETGVEYSTSNDPEPENLPIEQLTPGTVPSNGVFLDLEGTEVLSVAKWHCVLANECKAARSQCSSGSECCSGDCPLGVCRNIKPVTSKFAAKLSNRGGNRGGFAGQGGGVRRRRVRGA